MMWQFAVYLVVINGATFITFGRDKSRAVSGEGRRVAEKDLLFLAFIGGTLGAFGGRKHFHHKTRKEPFSTRLQIIAMLQAGVLTGLAVAAAPIG